MVAHFGRFISYLRVSTGKQGVDGYGIAAQREAVSARLNGGRWTLVAEFVEVESGKRRSRPELSKALAACRKLKAKLVVAKLDRLSRDTRFLLSVLDSGCDVLFADLPHIGGAMGRFVVTQMAAVAELEAGLISERTRAGLAVAKQRGVKLGATGLKLAAKHRAEAQARAEKLAPIIRALQQRGLSMRGIAGELSMRKVPTPRGGTWHPQLVTRIVRRLDLAPR
jgi:DNA invertase Pin-like site-specific DNA recombinase